MIKESVTYGVIFYVLLSAWQGLFEAEILWVNNIGFALVALIVYLTLEWLIKVYKARRNDNK